MSPRCTLWMILGTSPTPEERKFLSTISNIEVVVDPRANATMWLVRRPEFYELPKHPEAG